MARTSEKAGDGVKHTYELADPGLQLDLTSDPWFLSGKAASNIIGLDVIRPGSIRPEGGRFPIELSPASGQATWTEVEDGTAPLVDAFGLDYTSRFASIIQFHIHEPTTFGDYVYNVPSPEDSGNNWLLKRVDGTSFDAAIVGGTILINTDKRVSPFTDKYVAISEITGLSDDGGTDNVLAFRKTTDDHPVKISSPQAVNMKIRIVYRDNTDRRGIWVTNGRKFWLIQQGTYTLMLDLGTDDYLGYRWSMARVHRNLLMLTNPNLPCRIIRLGDDPPTATADNSSLAGLLPPRKPDDDEISDEAHSWVMRRVASQGSITNRQDADENEIGVSRVKVRATNVYDDAESQFVDAHDFDNIGETFLAPQASDGIRVYARNNTLTDEQGDGESWPPVTHERWTHLEIWRTTNLGVDYYREKEIVFVDKLNESADPDETTLNELTRSAIMGHLGGECELSDVDLSGFPLMSSADILSGMPPPTCRKVLSLQGITLCGGKAADNVSDVPLAYGYALMPDWEGGVLNYDSSDDQVRFTVDGVANYVFRTGDQFVLVATDGAGTPGTYNINSKVDDRTIDLATSPGGADGQSVFGYVQRPFTFRDWPAIEEDEEIWFSRTDVHRPESFSSIRIRVSNVGDEFKTMVNVGNYAAVIMRSGVHLLRFDGVGLKTDAVSTTEGTPWEYSVVTLDDKVFWAHPHGPKMMVVLNEPNDEGKRAVVRSFGEGTFRTWFRDAFDNGWEIDAGYDELNGCLRFRRTEDANTYQVLQISMKTGRATLLDDDNGMGYASTVRAVSGSASSSARLYSVEGRGNLFEVNYQDSTWPHASATVQDTIDTGDGYAVTTTSITKAGIFATSMAGDVVRFRSSTGSVDGVSRVIRTASANAITFDAVTDLANGDEFIIGAIRFRAKFAPFKGLEAGTVKTLKGVRAHIQPGDRTHQAAASVSVRTYGDYGTTAQDDNDREIDIFPGDEAGKITEDRHSAVDGQGQAIELEIESIESRNDFKVEQLTATVYEETDRSADTSTA